MQAQFERLQAEPEDVLRQSEEQRPTADKQIGMLSTSQEPIYLSQLPESQIQVTPPTRSLTKGPRLIKLQAPRSLDALQPVARPATIIKTEAPKLIVLKTRESEPLKTARNSVDTGKAVFTEKNQWIPSLPGWQRNGPKGLVNILKICTTLTDFFAALFPHYVGLLRYLPQTMYHIKSPR